MNFSRSRLREQPSRTPSRGVALVITLVMLAVITFMAVTFLVLSSREKGAVSTTTDQTTAGFASESAIERAKIEVLARIMAFTNDQNYGLIVSTNFINPAGFSPGITDPTNVNYNYLTAAAGGGALPVASFQQNVANLLYNPRPPVFVFNPTNSLIAPEFRYYLDLNRNGRYDTNGFLPVIDRNGNPEVFGGVTNFDNFIGDPEWIGILEYPDRPHSANNKFLARYAYIVVPAGQTLDLNYIHNEAASTFAAPYFFARNMGVGTWEMNLGAFLADLNTNQWGIDLFPISPVYYQYLPWNRIVNGRAFQDAQALVKFRYNGNLNNLQSMSQLFLNGAAPFQNDGITEFGGGGLLAAYMTGSGLPATDGDSGRLNSSWPGADNPNHYFTTQDFFDPAKASVPFIGRLNAASLSPSSYDRYTFYRMLAQLGTDSAPAEQGKINLNYLNVDINGNIVSGMETNLITWDDPRIATGIPGVIPAYGRPGSEVFFMNAADKVLRAYTADWTNQNLTAFKAAYQMTGPFGARQIPVFVNGQVVYGSSIHRLLQLVANIYDAMADRNSLAPQTASGNTLYAPTVFRPQFSRDINNNIFITNFVEVANNLTFLLAPNRIWDLGDTADLQQLPALFKTDDSVYNVPLVIGAKKGFPNFDKLMAQSSTTVVRKLQFHRTGVGKPPAAVVDLTNQTYLLVVSNIYGVDLWNSYSNVFPRPLQLQVGVSAIVSLTNQLGTIIASNTISTGLASNLPVSWAGYNSQSPKYSFQIPVFTNSLIVPRVGPPNNVWVSNQISGTLGFPIDEWFLTTRARTRCILIDSGSGRIIDYVALSAVNGPRDVTVELTSGATFAPSSGRPGDLWLTNRFVNGVENFSKFTPPRGIMNQILVGLGPVVGGPNPNTVDWNTYNKDPSYPGDIVASQQRFYFNMFGINAPGDSTKYITLLDFSAPFNPNRTVYQVVPLMVNDPLVHYTVNDLTDLRITNNFTADTAHFSPTNGASGLGHVSARYSPWGGNPNITGSSDPLADPNIFNMTVKDPLISSSDMWEFPTNRLPGLGWLGRIHRGTPWQTVYLKSSDALTNSANWQNWIGGVGSNSVTLSFSTANMAPVSDRLLFDLFTTAINDNATRGQLSVNQTNLAAWSAALGGLIVLTNDAATETVGWKAIDPAGYYDRTAPLSQQPPLVRIWQGINAARANTNAATGPVFVNHVFNHAGDILATPQLTEQSPFLDTTGLTNASAGAVSDAIMERIPQQVMSLLTLNHTPRFVIYAYGQTLKPADHSLVPSGPFALLCTNYQVTAETVTRAVVRVEGTSDPQYTSGKADVNGRSYPPRIVVERYNVLPPD